MLPLLTPSWRGRYLKPLTVRFVPRLTVNVCGGGGLAACHCVCQSVEALPSMALAAGAFAATSSALSALTVQPARGMTAPVASSTLNSAIDVHGLPLTSVTAS